jgi:hypothetical protein
MSNGSGPMTNPFIERANRQAKQSKAYWRSAKQEKELAKRLDARRISGSGNGIIKGDLCIPGLVRIEAKTTQRSSFVVSLSMIEKLCDAAFPCDEIPVLIIEFLDENGKPISAAAVIPLQNLEDLVERINNG